MKKQKKSYYIIPLIFKTCTTASPINTNIEMYPNAFGENTLINSNNVRIIVSTRGLETCETMI